MFDHNSYLLRYLLPFSRCSMTEWRCFCFHVEVAKQHSKVGHSEGRHKKGWTDPQMSEADRSCRLFFKVWMVVYIYITLGLAPTCLILLASDPPCGFLCFVGLVVLYCFWLVETGGKVCADVHVSSNCQNFSKSRHQGGTQKTYIRQVRSCQPRQMARMKVNHGKLGL